MPCEAVPRIACGRCDGAVLANRAGGAERPDAGGVLEALRDGRPWDVRGLGPRCRARRGRAGAGRGGHRRAWGREFFATWWRPPVADASRRKSPTRAGGGAGRIAPRRVRCLPPPRLDRLGRRRFTSNIARLLAVRRGESLVPEIALTPQLSARFRARSATWGVLHAGSRLRAIDQWRRLPPAATPDRPRARSAVFARRGSASLVVYYVDDTSFKQERGALPAPCGAGFGASCRAICVLGSARVVGRSERAQRSVRCWDAVAGARAAAPRVATVTPHSAPSGDDAVRAVAEACPDARPGDQASLS